MSAPVWDGVPLNPERDGFHWVRTPDDQDAPYQWRAAGECERGRWDARWIFKSIQEWDPRLGTYLGPCLAPTEVAAREAAAAEAMRAVCARAAMVEIGWNAAKAEVRKAIAMQAAHTVNAIRERPLPSPDALARLIADAEKRGMEKAAGIAEGLRDGNVEAIARCDWWGAQVAAAIRAAAKEPSNA